MGGRSRIGKVEAQQMHAHAAQLDADVGTAGKFAHRLAPVGEHLVALADIGTEAGGPADMVADDRRIGKGTRKIDQVRQVECAAAKRRRSVRAAKRGEALAELVIQEEAGRRVGAGAL